MTPTERRAAAAALGARGGAATAKRRTATERQAAALHAITARWAKLVRCPECGAIRRARALKAHQRTHDSTQS
jgi:hypothetical protein